MIDIVRYKFGIWAWGRCQLTKDMQETFAVINNIFTGYTLVDTTSIMRNSLISCLQCDFLLLGKLISSRGEGVS